MQLFNQMLVLSYVGDMKKQFSPILASTLENIFDQVFQCDYKQTILVSDIKMIKSFMKQVTLVVINLYLMVHHLLCASNTPSNISILLEEGLQPDGYDYDVAYVILDSSDGFNDEGGKIDVEVGSSTDEYDNILAEDGNVFALEDGFISQGDDILYEGFTVDNEVAGGVMKAESAHSGEVDKMKRHLRKNIQLS